MNTKESYLQDGWKDISFKSETHNLELTTLIKTSNNEDVSILQFIGDNNRDSNIILLNSDAVGQLMQGKTITSLCKSIHSNALNKGFWKDIQDIRSMNPHPIAETMMNNALGNRLMLIVDEVSEAHEDLRKGNMEHFPEEIADIMIRCMDLSEGMRINVEEEIIKKMQKNLVRPYLHGKKF